MYSSFGFCWCDLAYIKDAVFTEPDAFESGFSSAARSLSEYRTTRLICSSSRQKYLAMLMGFSYFGRLVTCVMLTVALSNAQHLPIQNSESAASVYVHCSVEHIEGQLVSLEDRLDHVQGIVSSLNNPLIKGRPKCWQDRIRQNIRPMSGRKLKRL